MVGFSRELQFDLSDLTAMIDKGRVEQQLDGDSVEGLKRLKALGERMLAEKEAL